MKKKVISYILAILLFIPCMFMFTACGPSEVEEIDPKLYHLTIHYTGVTLNDDQKADFKATFGDGQMGTTVVEGTRDEEEIKALKDAGATDADLAKAGVRQDDGSYYFFESDSIYIEYPEVDNYRFICFYYEGTDQQAHNPRVTGQYEKSLNKFFMPNRDVVLEARYEVLSYSFSIDNMSSGQSNDQDNPETGIIRTYCPLNDGDFVLKDAITTNPHEEFLRWEYEDSAHANGGVAEWIPLENNKLPKTFNGSEDPFTVEIMRIRAVFETEKLNVSFKFKYLEEQTPTDISESIVCSEIKIQGNKTTVGDQNISSAPVVVTGSSNNILVEYGSSFYVFVTPQDGYYVCGYVVNGIEFDYSTDSRYLNIYEDAWTQKNIPDTNQKLEITILFAVGQAPQQP